MTDAMQFKKLSLDDLGEGVSVAQIEHLITENARLLADSETYPAGTKARVTLVVEMVRDDDAVAITAGVTVAAPKPQKKRTYAFAAPNGELMVQKTEQLSLETIRREMAARGPQTTTAKAPGAAKPGETEKT